MRHRFPGLALVALAAWLAASLAAAADARAGERAEWYARATNQLGAVVLFKPAESTNQDLATRLAPLILQEVAPTNEPVTEADFLARLPGAGVTNRLTLYARERKVWLCGQSHDEVTYAWFYPPPATSAPTAPQVLPLQGVRITLDQTGHPVIWEPLAVTGAARPVFVAGSLEHLALLRHRARLPERQFVIEPDPARHPALIVPRTLDDSPVVFGPILYLRAGSHDCWTLICRCMPAQVQTVTAAYYYDLALWPKDLRSSLRGFPPSVRRQILTRLAEFEREDPRRQLRLPERF